MKRKSFPSYTVQATFSNVVEEDSKRINDDKLEMKTFGKCDVGYKGITELLQYVSQIVIIILFKVRFCLWIILLIT